MKENVIFKTPLPLWRDRQTVENHIRFLSFEIATMSNVLASSNKKESKQVVQKHFIILV